MQKYHKKSHRINNITKKSFFRWELFFCFPEPWRAARAKRQTRSKTIQSHPQAKIQTSKPLPLNAPFHMNLQMRKKALHFAWQTRIILIT